MIKLCFGGEACKCLANSQRDQCQYISHHAVWCCLLVPCIHPSVSVISHLMFGSLPLRVMDHLSVLYLSSTWSFCTFKDTTAIYLIFFFCFCRNYNWNNNLCKWKPKPILRFECLLEWQCVVTCHELSETHLGARSHGQTVAGVREPRAVVLSHAGACRHRQSWPGSAQEGTAAERGGRWCEGLCAASGGILFLELYLLSQLLTCPSCSCPNLHLVGKNKYINKIRI